MTWKGIPAESGYAAFTCVECGHEVAVTDRLIPDMDDHDLIHIPKEDIPYGYIPVLDRSNGVEERTRRPEVDD